MPIYDFKCPNCNHIIRDEFTKSWDEKVKCKRCGAVMKKLVSKGILDGEMKRVDQLDGVHLEHVSPTGKTFHSKKEMKEYAKKHNLELGYLL